MISLPRPHWSYSAISQYLRCPLQFYFKWVLKLPELRLGSGLLLGSAVHHALACYHQTLKHGGDVHPEKLHRAFRKHFAERASETTVDWKPGESPEALITLRFRRLERLSSREMPVVNGSAWCERVFEECLRMAIGRHDFQILRGIPRITTNSRTVFGQAELMPSGNLSLRLSVSR